MKIAVISANMGRFDTPVENAKQSVDYHFYRFTDANFPPRSCAMSPRLQARIPKCFGWQMAPGYDIYIWVDASFALLHEDSVKWLVSKVERADVAVLKHPMRSTIMEEAEYLKKRLREEALGKKEPYVTSRYFNELIDAQLKEIMNDEDPYSDNALYASTVFVYHNHFRVRTMLKDWWYHISRYHIVDQLSFPYVLWKHKCGVNVIPTKKHHDFKIPYLSLVRYR